MMNTMKLPVGIDDFRKLRESDFYYVDKTRLHRADITKLERGDSFYKTAPLWKNSQYEHA